jgi:drug/metabolite transporter (DMT)-like permease
MSAERAVLSRAGSVWSNGPALLMLGSLFWAGSIVVGRAAAAEVPPSLFTVLRWGGALLIVAPLAVPHLRRDWPALWRRKGRVVGLAVVGVGASNNLAYHGLHQTTAINALLLNSATPLFILAVAYLLFRERPSPRQLAAILISVAGVAVIAAEGSWTVLLALRFNPGDVLVTLGVLSYAIYSATLRLRPRVHPLSFLCVSMAIGGVAAMLPFAVIEWLQGARLDPTPGAFAALIYSAVFPAFLSYLFFNRGVELIGATRAGQYIHLMPVFGIVLAVVFLGEAVHPYHLVGIVLIAAGLWLAR